MKLFSLFLQSNCPLCQRSTPESICKHCQRQLQSFQLKNPCQFWQGELPLFVWGAYGGQLKRAIATLKYNNSPQIAELFGYWLAKAWINCGIFAGVKKLVVVPIPLHKEKLEKRGFNQAEAIARSFCQLTGYSLQSQGLERIRHTEAMFGLTPSQREQNLNNAFALGKAFRQHRPNVPVLIVDDIYTTGATVKEADRLLRQEGIPVFGVAALSTAKPV